MFNNHLPELLNLTLPLQRPQRQNQSSRAKATVNKILCKRKTWIWGKGETGEETTWVLPISYQNETKLNKESQSLAGHGGVGRAADPRKQELPASSRKRAQTRRLEGNPEGGAQRGIRGVWERMCRRE